MWGSSLATGRWNLYAIEVRERGAATLVTVRGELDLFSLSELQRTLDAVASLWGGAVVDLAGVTFLDLLSARELAVHAHLYRSRLALQNPSPEVVASIEAAGLGGWVRFRPDADRNGPQLVSGAS